MTPHARSRQGLWGGKAIPRLCLACEGRVGHRANISKGAQSSQPREAFALQRFCCESSALQRAFLPLPQHFSHLLTRSREEEALFGHHAPSWAALQILTKGKGKLATNGHYRLNCGFSCLVAELSSFTYCRWHGDSHIVRDLPLEPMNVTSNDFKYIYFISR